MVDSRLVGAHVKYGGIDRGSMALFTAIGIVPILFLALIFSVEFSRFFAERSHAQNVIDSAALLGGRHLPYANAVAIPAAVQYLALHPELKGVPSFSAGAGRFSITFRGKARISFLDMFGLGTLFDYTVVTSARTTPRNIVVFFDSSSYMAPPIFSSAGTLNTAEYQADTTVWPVAKIFKKQIHGGKIAFSFNSNVINRRVISQQCFNAGYSALKEAAIRIVDFALGNPLNSVGVFTGPGQKVELPIIRDVLPPPADPYAPNNSAFGDYSSNYVGDAHCLAAAAFGDNSDGTSFPARAADLGGNEDSQQDALRLSMVAPSWLVPAAQVQMLSLRQAIWGHAVRWADPAAGGNNQFSVQVDARAVINRARSMLLGAPYRPERAGITEGVSNIAYLLFGDVPWIIDAAGNYVKFPTDPVKKEVRKALKRLNDQAAALNQVVTIHWMILTHTGNCPGQTHGLGNVCPVPSTHNADYAAFRDWIEGKDDNWDNLNITMYDTDSGGSLTENWAMHVPLSEHVAVLAKEDTYAP